MHGVVSVVFFFFASPLFSSTASAPFSLTSCGANSRNAQIQVVKRKMLEAVFPDLKTGESGACLWKDKSFEVSGFGACTCPVPAGYAIS
jgi:hypothetical protein